MKFYTKTDRGKVRKVNQDSSAVEFLENGALAAVVCDGMGGANAGELASSIACGVFMDGLRSAAKNGAFTDLRALVGDCVNAANTEVYTRSLADETCRGMGTTLVGAIVTPDETLVFNIGDSRAYLLNRDSIRRITRDHSYVELLVENGEISEEEARVHPQKNLITRALGVDESVICDFFSPNFTEGLLLCSDGLSNVVTDNEIHGLFCRNAEPKNLCTALVRQAIRRGAPDNVTVTILIQ